MAVFIIAYLRSEASAPNEGVPCRGTGSHEDQRSGSLVAQCGCGRRGRSNQRGRDTGLLRQIDDRGREHRRLTGNVLLAEPAAAIAIVGVAIVAFLGGIKDTVAAAQLAAVGAAEGVGRIGVHLAVVTLFAGIQLPVAAEARHDAAVGAAGVRQALHAERAVALLSQLALDNAVAAVPLFQPAEAGASVAGDRVSVVTLFTLFVDRVATDRPVDDHGRIGALTHTDRVAAVTGAVIAVVTLFSAIQQAVAALRDVSLRA